MGKVKKIAFLTHVLSNGGASMSLLLHLKALMLDDSYEKHVWYPSYYSPDASFLELIKKHCDSVSNVGVKDIHNHQVGRMNIFQCLFRSFKGKKQLIQRLIDENIDVIHINTTVFPHLLKIIKKKTKVKIIVHVRELIPKHGIGLLHYYFVSRISKYSDVIIAISDNEAKVFNFNSNLKVVPNPFDFENIRSFDEEFRSQYKIDEKVLLVGMLAAFQKEKGHLILLESIRLFKKQYPFTLGMKFVFIGVPPKRKNFLKIVLNRLCILYDHNDTFYQFIERNALHSDIILIPYTTSPLNLIKEMDIIVRPSLTGDPWGRDIIEGMALKKPIIATGESSFYVEDNINGFLIPKGDANILAEKISYLLKHENVRKKFGNNGYNKVYNLCNLKNYQETVKEIYSKF